MRFNFVFRDWRDLFEYGVEQHPFSNDVIYLWGPLRFSYKMYNPSDKKEEKKQ